MKIGIAVTTTPNRQEVFEGWYKAYTQNCPEIPLYIHNDVDYKGVVYSKNKCLAALYEAGCTHFFLFDDDCFINNSLWFQYYIKSGLEHACYTFNRKMIDPFVQNVIQLRFVEFVDPNGCMLFFTRKCVETVGGWDTDFKGYGYEHSNLSCRIFNAGLTPARFIDVKRPNDLFKMADCYSSFSEKDREEIPSNFKLYKEKFNSKEFKPFQ